MNEEQVLREYGPRVRSYVRSLNYFLPGGEIEDLEQEGLIGLLRGCRTWHPEHGVPFWPGFAYECVRRQVFTAIKTANRGKHAALTSAWRRGWNEYGDEYGAEELIEDPRGDVERLAEARDELRRVSRLRGILTDVEDRAIFGSAAGYRLDELGRRKQMDNAGQRGLAKLRRAA